MTTPSLWRNNFRPMFASTTATNLGDGVMAVPVPWLATLLTHDPLLIGLVAGARTLPRRVPPPNPAKLMVSLREGLGRLWHDVRPRRLALLPGGFTFGALIAWAVSAGTVQAVLLRYAMAAGTGMLLTSYAAFRLRLD